MLERQDGLLVSSSLVRLFSPKSIAVVGASEDPARIGGRPIAASIEMGYEGDIYPINPKYDSIFGRKCYQSLLDLDCSPDLIVVAVGTKFVPGIIEQAASLKAGSVVVFSSGYGEIGGEGEVEQERLRVQCEDSGVILLGPNCLGVINSTIGAAASFTATLESGTLKSGNVGFACQSGAFGSYFLALARRRDLGVGNWIATGNEAVVTIADCISYLADDPKIEVIAGYIEGVRNGPALMSALERASDANKPVVLLKAGRSEAGSRAAKSHTGAMVGDDRAIGAVFDHFGVERASDLDDLIHITESASFGLKPKSKRVCLLTVSGGVGIMMADEAAEVGLELPALPDDIKARLKELVPFAGLENPVDFTGQFLNDANIAGEFLEVLASSSLFDSILVYLGHTSLAQSLAGPAIRRLIEVRHKYQIPILLSGLTTPTLMDELRQAGVPVLENPVEAVRLLASLFHLFGPKTSKRRSRDSKMSVGSISDGVYPERESLEMLASAQVPTVESLFAETKGEALTHALALGFPVVVKADCPALLHKSEAGAVLLGINDSETLANAFDLVVDSARKATDGSPVRGVLIQKMIRPLLELIVGVKRDPNFGHLIAVGTGGVLAELISDSKVALVEGLDEGNAIEMLSKTAAGKALISGRFKDPDGARRLALAVVRVAKFVTLHPEISELDINPLAVTKDYEVVALDSLVVAKAEGIF